MNGQAFTLPITTTVRECKPLSLDAGVVDRTPRLMGLLNILGGLGQIRALLVGVAQFLAFITVEKAT